MFVIPSGRHDAPFVVKGLKLIFKRRAHVQNSILMVKGAAFTAEVMQLTTEEAGIKIKHTTVKLAKAVGMKELSHQKLKKILEINKSVDQPQWDQNGNIAVIAHNTTYNIFLKYSPTEGFHGRTPHSALDFKLQIRFTPLANPKICQRC